MTLLAASKIEQDTIAPIIIIKDHISGFIFLTSFRKVSSKPGATFRSKTDFEQKVNIYISIYEPCVKFCQLESQNITVNNRSWLLDIN